MAIDLSQGVRIVHFPTHKGECGTQKENNSRLTEREIERERDSSMPSFQNVGPSLVSHSIPTMIGGSASVSHALSPERSQQNPKAQHTNSWCLPLPNSVRCLPFWPQKARESCNMFCVRAANLNTPTLSNTPLQWVFGIVQAWPTTVMPHNRWIPNHLS